MNIKAINLCMSNKNKKNILIYNPVSNIGHFDSWCSIFTCILLESNWSVCVVTKNSNIINKDTLNLPDFCRNNLIVLDDKSKINNQLIYRIFEKLLKITSILRFFELIKIDISKLVVSKKKSKLIFLSKINNYLINRVEFFFRRIFQPTLAINPFNPLDFAEDINLISKSLIFKPDFVINMYLDLYQSESSAWVSFARTMKFNWAGIHMDLTHTHINKSYLLSPTLLAIFSINDPVLPIQIDQKSTSPNFIWFPDVTNITLPNTLSSISRAIQQQSAGRKIIFLGGAIGGTKNLSLWIDLIYSLDKSEWFFVQIGKVDYSTLSAKDLQALQRLQLSLPENIYISDTYLPDESIFNELISISTVVWGLYRDFDRSSNILTKAALLSKPIIVSNKYLMGHRVTNYQIGIAVSETNLTEVINGIIWLTENPIPSINFDKYASVFSTRALSKVLNQSLESFV